MPVSIDSLSLTHISSQFTRFSMQLGHILLFCISDDKTPSDRASELWISSKYFKKQLSSPVGGLPAPTPDADEDTCNISTNVEPPSTSIIDLTDCEVYSDDDEVPSELNPTCVHDEGNGCVICEPSSSQEVTSSQETNFINPSQNCTTKRWQKRQGLLPLSSDDEPFSSPPKSQVKTVRRIAEKLKARKEMEDGEISVETVYKPEHRLQTSREPQRGEDGWLPDLQPPSDTEGEEAV